MDKVDNNFKKLLKIVLEKRMSVDTILQILNLSELPNWTTISEELLKVANNMTERQLREKISQLIIKN